ncbi:carboxypeptidase-like regulatory domain-containing protein [Amycolatopsis sp. DSM 110486]|uniref:carboxypeptidase-like regulatory domain-containing protein n=1 Tax=Amycolatopsis sp. DSM 110486 TaxID=2865832 RepID=UPI001C6A4B6F|nr:carboxypeptidase-like regulatory domain-containing protein [Amycolatopsis sp. DSM 110486]QYN16776.1 carboxypeptidase-like regulatory domain-containing protein [Amycolatopsis sp. DSM 110486]
MRKSLWFALPAAVLAVAAVAAPLDEDAAVASVKLDPALSLDRTTYEPGAPVRGTLTLTNDTGRPVYGVHVTCASADPADRMALNGIQTNQPLQGGFSGTLRADQTITAGLTGRVTEDGVRRGGLEATCVVTAGGFVMLSGAAADVIGPVVPVNGHVVEDGKPVAGVTVVAASQSLATLDQTWTAVSGPDGSYRLSGLRAGYYLLKVPGRAVENDFLYLVAGTTADHVVVLTGGE